MNLTSQQKKTVLASFLGWTLDAFDFFLLTFLLTDIATEFGTDVPAVSKALFLTLATRFIGAFFFGMLADKYGRKPILMLNIVSYSVIGALAAFSPNLGMFLALARLVRHRHGRRMGAWQFAGHGIRSRPARAAWSRASCNAAIRPAICWRRWSTACSISSTIGGYTIGWRAMFLLSFVPALIVLFIRSHVPESPAFVDAQKATQAGTLETLQKHWGVALYAVVLMMFFNFFSHGTQDLYPTFLKKQHGFDPHTVSWITIVANIGAIVGGLAFGALSEKIGRVNAITLACLIALPSISLWAYSTTPFMLAIGAFVMQVAVQGAWGVIPVHLNELRPARCARPCPASSTRPAILLASYGGPYPGGHRRKPRRQLRLRAGAFCRRGRGLHHRRHPLQPGTARPGDDGARLSAESA